MNRFKDKGRGSFKAVTFTGVVLLLAACSNHVPTKNVYSSLAPTNIPINFTSSYPVISEGVLIADGPYKGLDAYALIKNFAGPRSIESPGLYANNHPGEPHIYEAKDAVVGNHFVFTLHKNNDKDRDVVSIKDRQRNEIKGYAGSSDTLKAFKSEVVSYSWKFKLNEDITMSKNFGHFFQLKAVDGGVGTPILTISGRDKEGEWLEVIHTIHGKKTVLTKVPLEAIKGRWLQVNAYVDYSNDGKLDLMVTDMTNGRRVIDLSLADIDMLRGEGKNDFVRPKWGIYRSLRSQDMLREEEEKVFFADFLVQKLQPSSKS
ncbi:heparin lyase I family protein [Psychromonas algicola]|uniref:heparin lyase I family protein n=1 Tax=Psychromonas algicola TaxID=2555642 RepID=UPI001419582E|nr:heparin lyase I family protein [Psychromonas sp. RZ5]